MLLLRNRASRIRRDAEAAFERLVEATAVGVRVATSRESAMAWQRRMIDRHGATTQSVEQYRGTVARLAALQSRGRKLGLVN